MSKEITKNIKPADINSLEIFRRVLKIGREAIEETTLEYGDVKPNTQSLDNAPPEDVNPIILKQNRQEPPKNKD